MVPVALCNFTVALWNMGGTCITNVLHNVPSPDCRKTAKNANFRRVKKSILQECRHITAFDVALCKQNPNHETCKTVAREDSYCTQLAMSF